MKTTFRFLISSAIGSLLFCAALAALIRSASALPADFDLTFNGTGKVTTAIGSIHDEGRSVAIQNDGKIVVAGYSFNGINNDIAVVRYNTDGSLDTSFGGTGKVTTAIDAGDDFGNGYSVAIQSHDGKIVVAAHSFNGANYDIAVVRYNIDGSIDLTFNGTGKVTTDFGLGDDKSRCVAVQNDGKIVVAGSAFTGTGLDFAVVRYNTNGTLDTTFNGTGKVTTAIGSSLDEAACVAIQKDGKIVVSGASDDPTTSYDWALVRYNTNGTLDTTFNGTGKLTTDFNNIEGSLGVAVQSDGKIVAAGHSQVVDTDLTLARYNTNGSLDTTFGGTGKVTTDVGVSDFAFSVAIQSNGKIVVSGSPWFTVARYNTDGSLDTTFNGTGTITTFIGSSSYGRGVAIQRDGKIVVAGGNSAAFGVVRFQGDLDTDHDGILDWHETGTGIYVSLEDTGTSSTNSDSDNDGLQDGAEVFTHHSNPNLQDSDGDGFLDGYEYLTGHSPIDIADHPALVAEARTAVEFTFPSALGKTYRIEGSPDLVTWTTVEDGIAGNGGVIQRFYSTRDKPKGFLRVEEGAP